MNKQYAVGYAEGYQAGGYQQIGPTPRREWVGLTTDERENILRIYYADVYDAAEVIEELLKEKNT